MLICALHYALCNTKQVSCVSHSKYNSTCKKVPTGELENIDDQKFGPFTLGPLDMLLSIKHIAQQKDCTYIVKDCIGYKNHNAIYSQCIKLQDSTIQFPAIIQIW